MFQAFIESDKVFYRGAFGRDQAKPATIVGIGQKNGRLVYDVRLDDGGECWGYADQITRRNG